MYKLMKKRFMFLLVIITLVFCGCSEEKADEIEAEDVSLSEEEAGSVAENVEVNLSNEETESVAKNENIIEYSEDGLIKFEKDQNGKLVRKDYYFEDGVLDYYEIYEWDKEDVNTGKTAYDSDDTILYINTFEWDANGNLAKYNIYNAQMVLEQIATYKRDENGVAIGIDYNGPDGFIDTEVVLDSEGRAIRQYIYNNYGEIQFSVGLEYDEKNRVIKRTHFLNSWSELIDWFEEYKYDSHNNVIETKGYEYSYEEDKIISTNRYIYEYDEQDRRIKTSTYSMATGEMTNYSLTEYFEGMRRDTNYTTDGIKKTWTEYYYDENGEEIGAKWYNEDGSIMFDTMPKGN